MPAPPACLLYRGIGWGAALRPPPESAHTRTRMGRRVDQWEHTRSPRRCLSRGGRSAAGPFLLIFDLNSSSSRQRRCVCHQRYAHSTEIFLVGYRRIMQVSSVTRTSAVSVLSSWPFSAMCSGTTSLCRDWSVSKITCNVGGFKEFAAREELWKYSRGCILFLMSCRKGNRP